MLSIVFDIAILIVIVGCIMFYLQKGFVAGLLNFLGIFVAFVASYAIAKNLGTPIFNNFFRDGLVASVQETIGHNNNISLEEVIHSAASFIPLSLVTQIADQLAPTLGTLQVNAAELIVDKAIAVVLIPVISFVIFIICFVIFKLLVKFLSGFFKGINNIPVVGGLNKGLGALMGIFIGVLYAFFVVSIIWVIDASSQMTFIYKFLPDSFVLNTLDSFNFFK